MLEVERRALVGIPQLRFRFRRQNGVQIIPGEIPLILAGVICHRPDHHLEWCRSLNGSLVHDVRRIAFTGHGWYPSIVAYGPLPFREGGNSHGTPIRRELLPSLYNDC